VRGALVAVMLFVVLATPASAYRNPTAGRDVALQIPGMHLAKVRRNLVYKPGLRMDVYRPRAATRPLPAVLFVHGTTGNESPKDWGQYVGWGQLAAASGLAGVTFNHQEDPADIAAAIRYVRRNGTRLGIDGTRLCVAGFSAGVHPAVLTALDGSAGKLRCSVAYYGFLWTELPQVSPTAHLRADSLPVLVTKAGRDLPGLNRTIDQFVAKARKVHAPVEILVHATAPHAFDVNTHDARSRAIMRRTLAFLKLHLSR
jgi:dienelactone hydrolase